MNHIQWSQHLEEERKFIQRKMEENGLKPSQLAGLANLGTETVVRLLDGLTYRPGHRTMIALFDALGYEVVRLPKNNISNKRLG